MNGNITTAPLGGNRNIKTKPLFQYDYGQVLKIIGVTLPAAYEVHFSNQLHGVATTQIGNADGVIIPDIYLTTGEPVYAWIYLHTGNSDGETEYTITIPVVRRASISDAEPTPVQQDVITQAIAALNTAVEQTAQDVQDATEAKQDAEEAAGNAYESAVAAAQSATNAGTYAGQAQSAQAASELAHQKAEEAQTGAQTAKWAAESAQTAAEAAQAGAVAARTGAETAQAWAVAARSGAEAAQHAAEAARDEITGLSATANTLPAGSQATASYADGTLTLGIPQGAKGDTGDTGATPDLTIGTVSTLPAGSSATASITGTDEQPVLNLGIPKGDQGEVSQAEFDALADDMSDMQDTLEHKADIDGYYTDMTVGAAEQVVSSTMFEDNAPYKFRTSGGSADIGNRAYVDKIVGGTVAWNQQVRDAASENSTDFADIVTVTDAVVDDAAVKVQIEPVQDLHGYDSPWPAGGGRNLLPDTPHTAVARECTFTFENGHVTLTGTAGGNGGRLELCTLPFSLKAGTYYLNIYDISGNNEGVFVHDGTTILVNGNSNTRNIPFVLESDSDRIAIGMNVINGTTYNYSALWGVFPSIELYSPYSNLCPISGWDEVKVTRSGANLCDPDSFITGKYVRAGNVSESQPLGSEVDSNYWACTDYIPVTPSTVYTQCLPTHQSANDAGLVFYADKTVASAISGVATISQSNAIYTFTTPATCKYVRFSWNRSVVHTTEYTNPQLTASNTALPYEPYQGNTYSITLPTEAGTVYGGTYDAVTGTLTLTHKIIDLGTLDWTNGGNLELFFSTGIREEIKLPASNADTYSYGYCDTFQFMSYNAIGTRTSYKICVSAGGSVGVNDGHQYASVNAFKTAMSGIHFCYELATPIPFSTDGQTITTLLGTNHVWSDAGQLSLTYTGTDEHLVLTTGRKYLTRISGADSMVLGAGQTVTAAKGTDNVFDLTQMFGTAVADYVYQQGAGLFRKWFGASRYAYNAGELISVQGLQSRDVVGFNAYDNGTAKVLGDNQYQITGAYTALSLDGETITPDANGLFTPAKTGVLTVTGGGADTCVHLTHSGTRNGTYEPYTHRSYPLDSALTLRGIPKVDSNGVYWDGDEYAADGTVERRYVEFIIDGNAVSSFATSSAGIKYVSGYVSSTGIDGTTNKITSSNYSISSSGLVDKSVRILASAFYVYNNEFESLDDAKSKLNASPIPVVYELATPTTETATPYQHIQSVDDWGTEEFVSSTITPVGHQSRYPQNLRDKLQHLPALASANGSYIITQTNGQMVLSPYPAPPTTAGNYLLKATVSGGNATYSWVAQ